MEWRFSCRSWERKEISVLGHVVNREGLKPQQQKVDVIANWPQPNSKDELSRFLGLCGYYRRFIPSFADITSSLPPNSTYDVGITAGMY